MFILAQICGLIALLMTIINIQLKSKEKIVMLNVWANIAVTIQYFLLGAHTGAVISILNAIRDVVYFLFKKKSLKPSILVLLIFEIVAIISGIISWQDIWSVIPIVVTIIYTYGLWQDDIKILRITTVIIGYGWTIYDIVVKAYVAALQVIAQGTSALIALAINNKNKKDKWWKDIIIWI